MKTNLNLLQTRISCAVALGLGSLFGVASAAETSADTPPAATAIPWAQLRAKAAANPTFSDANWSSMGGMAGGGYYGAGVNALAVSGSDLYVGGVFTTAGGSPANSLAKWNGSNWSALGSGLSGGDVIALAVSGGDLFAGGWFTTAGGKAATNIAKWDGSSWSALGSGLDGPNPYVKALAVSGGDLYAGGGFMTAGGKVSELIARACLPTLPTVSVLRSGENVTVSWPAVDTAGFALEQTDSLAAAAGWVTNSVTVSDDSANKSVTLPGRSNSQFFRLGRP